MRRGSIVIATVTCLLMLAGCHTTASQGGGSGTSGDSGGSASPKPTVEVSDGDAAAPPPASAGVVLPIDCHKIVNATMYASTFGSMPLNDPAFGPADPNGVVTPTTAAPGAAPHDVLLAGVQLHCLWADPAADITSLDTKIGTADAAAGTAWLASLPAQGYTCQAKYDGQWCQRVKQNSQYPVDEGSTEFVRDGVYISVLQINVATSGYLAEIVKTIWG